MDPTIVVAVVTGTFALIATVLGLRASGRVTSPPAQQAGRAAEAEQLAWHIATSTMEQQRARIERLEGRVRRLEVQLRGLGATPDP